MDRFASFRNATSTALLGPGVTSVDLRQDLLTGVAPPDLASLVEKIRNRAYTVSDADLHALRAAYTDDQLFEIVVVSAFGGALDRLTAAHKALERA